jgi:acetyl esterase/lipase
MVDIDETQFPNRLPEGTRRSKGMPRERLPIEPQAGLDIEEFEVNVRDGTPIRLRSYRKSEAKDAKLPLFFYMHGGGYVYGGLETDDATCRTLAAELDLLVLNVEYRLAPEHKFPVGFEDCHDLVQWVRLPTGAQERPR